MGRELKEKALSGVIWTFLQQFSVQIINFVVQIILARLLMPEMFGIIAMLGVFISIGESLMDGGMTNSLIRTRNPDQLDYSTVFISNFIVGLIIYCFVFALAPYIADFYDQELLKNILRVYALIFVIKSFVAVHVAKLTKEMNFKIQMKLQLPSTIIGAIIGVSLAFLGYGVWSLVWLNLTQAIFFTIQNWIFIDWKPSFIFNKERFKHHFNFGYKMTLSGLLDAIYNDAYKIVIGKYFTPASVGFFSQAESMRLFPVLQISSVVSKVTYPLFSSLENDEELKRAYKVTMKLLFFLVVPIMMILIVCSEELFLVLFGEKWLASVPYFQILAFASIIRPLGSYNLNILKVKGRSDLFLKVEVIKKIIGFAAIALVIPFGMYYLVISCTIVSYLSTMVNMIFSGRLIKYSFWEQCKDSFSVFLIGVVCMAILYFVRIEFLSIIDSSMIRLFVLPLIYLSLYLLLTYLFNKSIISLIKQLVKKYE